VSCCCLNEPGRRVCSFAGTDTVSFLRHCAYENVTVAVATLETGVSFVTCVVPEAPMLVQRFIVGYLAVSTDTKDTSHGYSHAAAGGEFVYYAEPEMRSISPIVAPSFTAGTALTVLGKPVSSAWGTLIV
jgi:hypothetical protein